MNKGLSYLEDLEYITRMYTALMEMKYEDEGTEDEESEKISASEKPDPQEPRRDMAPLNPLKEGGSHV